MINPYLILGKLYMRKYVIKWV